MIPPETAAAPDLPSTIQSPLLSEGRESGIRHGFFTREGGVSEGIYQGLNVGVGSADSPDRVQENRRRVAGWFAQPTDRLVTVHQVHSPDVAIVDAAFEGDRPKADAIVTRTPGLILGVLTADCGPILFADCENRVIGAAHAGWKGALDGVLENTIDAMVALGANRDTICATLGPSISQRNYEVGPEFVERFVARDPVYAQYFIPSDKPDHAMFDLPGLTLARLGAAGIKATALGHCTYSNAQSFYSYRRTTHAGEPDYGRQISAIVIEEN
ncbi:peptidoglycan editing factor PgeF [Peteryoungia ipomoeae]|uniref:Purine nucleoside phosphorylase n=1 Tax=Peteryoungia ipomoeae TaxID=1210932 RepID=A0A4S8P5U5_9HYPH|nr:peptidoglycan editing factor PgeF [Peteryoungia ipomoeae]THV24701.1 peptidoglycan editing factor PgeF [Peteryoungia ipomoeae]